MQALLDLFRDIRDRDLRRRGYTIGEGRLVVERMLASSWRMLAVLCTPAAAPDFEALAKDRCPVLTLPETEIRALAGFRFHRGVMAAALRPEPASLEEMLETPGDGLILVCPDVTEAENIGVIIRTAAGLGIRGAVLGPRACDPYLRRVLRVSMGAVCRFPIAQMADEEADVERIKARGYRVVGTVLDEDAVPLAGYRAAARTAVVVGTEGTGLDADWKARCDDLVTIPMAPGVDSLNVSVAAGIFLYVLDVLSAGRTRA